MPVAEDLALIAAQEKELAFDRFDEEQAWVVGSLLREMAVSGGFRTLAIDVRRFGQPLFYATVGATIPDNAEWVRRKYNVVARFHRSSYAMYFEMQQRKTTLVERYGLPVADYVAAGGGFPLHVANAGVVGSITVSGLPQRDDHNLVVEALCTLLGRDYATLKLPPE